MWTLAKLNSTWGARGKRIRACCAHGFPIALVLLMILGLSSQANAGLASADDTEFGADSLTIDSDTNLAWLDLEFTIARSYNDVSSKLGAEGEFEGFRYATEAEVLAFFVNAGIPDVPGNSMEILTQ